MPVQVNDDGDSNGRLCGGNGDDEQGKEQSVQFTRPQVVIKRDEIYIDTVQDELQRHEHGHQVPSRKESEHTDEEQRRAKDQKMTQWNLVHADGDFGFNAMTMQPIMAASSMPV